MHTRDLLKKLVKFDKIDLVPAWHNAEALFSAQERAALAWTEPVARVAQSGVPDEDFQAAIAIFS
jgi:alkylhydroperoxidase family enzyme